MTKVRAAFVAIALAVTSLVSVSNSTALAEDVSAESQVQDTGVGVVDANDSASSDVAEVTNESELPTDGAAIQIVDSACEDPVNYEVFVQPSYVDLPMFKIEKLIDEAVKQGNGIEIRTVNGGPYEKLQIIADEVGKSYLESYFANTRLLDSVDFQTPSGANWSYVYWLQGQVVSIFVQDSMIGGVGIGLNGEINVMTNKAGYDDLANQLDPADLQNLTFELAEDFSFDIELGQGASKP